MAFNIARTVCILMLFAAMYPMPHEYYSVERYVLLAMGLYGCTRAYKHRSWGWVAIFGGMAILYNPIHHFKLGRENWQPVDMIVAMVLILSFYLVREGKPMHTRVETV